MLEMIKARDVKVGDRIAHTLGNGETVLKSVTGFKNLELNMKMLSFGKSDPEFLDSNIMVAVLQ